VTGKCIVIVFMPSKVLGQVSERRGIYVNGRSVRDRVVYQRSAGMLSSESSRATETCAN
jgi:hypothetical protein